ncbi:MAG: hypothetical protein Q7J84_00045 [Sulfuricaulis sp.]|nr:hypothetical protein [Sulfuricaulis sp.]
MPPGFTLDQPVVKKNRPTFPKIGLDPTEGMSGMQKFNAGVGKAFVDIGRGAAQMVGQGPDAAQTQENRALDRPLMNTGAGMSGNVAGNISMLAPLAVVPGGATVAGAGTMGALAGALQPTEGVQERLGNMGTGLALGAGTQAAVGPGARALGEWGAGREQAAAMRQSQNSVRDATLKAGQEAGYVVPPSNINPSAANKIIESIGGRAATTQAASFRNQEVTNRLAAEALGMPKGAPLSESGLESYRKSVAQPYRDVAALSQRAQIALEQLKDARFNANNYTKFYSRSGDPNALAAATNFRQKADALETSLEGFAQNANKPDLIEALRKARTQIAKSYDVERALNVGSGDVSARLLGSALDKGRPLTGELATAGRFSEAFPTVTQNMAGKQAPGVSNTTAILSALLGGAGGATFGPGGVAAAALPLARGPARSLALQLGKSVKPDYTVGGGTKAAAALADPETRRRVAMMARALMLPSVPQLTGAE